MRSTGPTSDPPQIGRYQVIRHLATGGMAQIYLARMDGMASFERHVVLKTILANRANDRRFINMFLDEAKLAATLNHQNIAQVYEVDQADGAYFMAMEYVHGENCRAILETSIRRGQQIPIELAVLIVSGAAAGLHHAHERKGKTGQALNIVHRDVSPANIMVGYDGSVKVLDFGIAKAEERYTQTVGSTIKGKYGYMSPEQCKGKAIDRRSDIFALGIVLYELTTQRRAFKGRDDFDTMKRIVASDLILPSSLVPGYPTQLEAVILKALSTEPDDRYSTAQDMIEALDVFTQRAKLTSTNTAMARFMVQLFGEPREPWETVPVDARSPASSSPSVTSSDEFVGQDDLRTTVLGVGSTTLPPTSAMVPPRTVTVEGVRNASATTSPAAGPRTPSVAGGRVQAPTTPPPLRGQGSQPAPTSVPAQVSGPTSGRVQAPPTTPPPLRTQPAGQVPVARTQQPSGPQSIWGPAPAATPSRGQPQPPARRALTPSAPPPGSEPAARLFSSSTSPMPAARPRIPSRGTTGDPTPPGYSGRGASPSVMDAAALRGADDAPSSPQVSLGRAQTPSAPVMRLTPGAPLAVPLVPRTVTPQVATQPALGPFVRQPSSGEGSFARPLSEDGPSRVQSSVMAPLPRPESLSGLMISPPGRAGTSEPAMGTPPIKHRWVILAVLFVVLAAVGLMIAIALTSTPTP